MLIETLESFSAISFIFSIGDEETTCNFTVRFITPNYIALYIFISTPDSVPNPSPTNKS